MKKIIVLLMFVVLAIAVSSCAPEPQGIQQGSVAVQVDEAFSLLVQGVLIAFFTAGTIYIFEKTGLDLKQYAIPVAISVSTFLVAALQGWINAQPIEYDPWIALALRIVGAVLVSFGTLRLFSKQPATLLP